MSANSPRCKITVVKRILNRDLIEQHLEAPDQHPGVCDCFTEGQEFFVEEIRQAPEGFRPWAWADIRKEILMVAGGGKMYGMKQPCTAIAGCSDWFRPMIFKVEKAE